MILLTNITGLVVIGAIIWWFWISKPRSMTASDETIQIIVDNGVYSPSRLEVTAGKTVRLKFLRKDPNPCAEQVVFADFDVTRTLPLDKPVELKLTPSKPGEYDFTCQMQMYRGTLVVKA